MAAVLANWGGYYSQRVYLGEARRMGLRVRPPHVNYSGMNFQVREGTLYMGLEQVRELTRRSIERILRFAPFASLDDFLTRVDPRLQEAENLAKVGALEGLGTIPSILRRLQNGGWQRDQLSLFEWANTNEEDWTLEQKVQAQMELLGASLDAHPLELAAEKIKAAGALTILEAVERIGRRVTIAGVRQTSHRSRTTKGDPMLFLTLEDLTGALDAILFPDAYRNAKTLVSSSVPLLITGMMEMDLVRGEPYLRVEKVGWVE
jgi:DNA polymerase III alpha subunit